MANPRAALPDTAYASEVIPDFDGMSTALKNALRPLTSKQQRFVLEYIQDLDIHAAYERAGYKPGKKSSNVYRLFRSRSVQAAIECALEIKLQRQLIDRDWIEDNYIALYFKATARNDLSVARGCLRDLAEHHGMFVKQVAVMRGDEIERRLAAGRERAGAVIDGQLEPAPALGRRPETPNGTEALPAEIEAILSERITPPADHPDPPTDST